jgi:signal transduction histidine kinase
VQGTSSVRLTDLRRTTSFRLAVLFLLLFGTAAALLCTFLYMQTRDYLDQRADQVLLTELNPLEDMGPAELHQLLLAHVAMDPHARRPITLFGPGGGYLAGSQLTAPQFRILEHPTDRPFTFMLQRDGRAVPFRGVARNIQGNQRLLVAQDMTSARAFRNVLLEATLWGGLATIVLGLIGAVVAGAGAVRHIEGITRAVQSIVRGDLSRRLPTHGYVSELDRLAHEINFMLGEIERLMMEVKGVCDNVAHDLRTPLTRLLAGLERVRRRAGSVDDYAVAVDDAIREIRGLLKTFAAMLRIAEVESGARRAGFTAVDLAQIGGDVVEFYEPMAEQKGIALRLVDGTSVPMQGDSSLLFEVLSNLVDNALKFTPSGGRIDVRVFADDATQGFEVSDTGPGIPAEQREAVLRRFYRAEQSRHTPGSGLGLALVAGVAGLHGMTVRIEDAKPGCRIALLGPRNLPGANPGPAASVVANVAS